MEAQFLKYYERELTYIRRLAAEFAGKHPKVAGRLLLEPDKCEDPHAERLMEAFAFVTGRLHQQIDDGFPGITEPLLGATYPHWVNPTPAMSIVEFEPAGEGIPPSGYKIEKHAPLQSGPVDGGVPCRFVTCYPVTLWPVEVALAELREPEKLIPGARKAMVIQLKCLQGVSFSEMGWRELRFYLNGPRRHVLQLHELLLNNVCRVECEHTNHQGSSQVTALPPNAVKPVGFGPDELVLPRRQGSLPGYLLLYEYFAFPERFLFFDLGGLDGIKHTGVCDTMNIRIYLDRPPKPNLVVSKETFRVNACPVVNLFEHVVGPIKVEAGKTEYPVLPNFGSRKAAEVLSVDKVSAARPSLPSATMDFDFRPYFVIGHRPDEDDHNRRAACWHDVRRPSGRKDDDGTDVFLRFTGLDFKPVDPDAEWLTFHLTCSNRDLPSLLPLGDPTGDFHMEKGTGPVSRINCLLKPTLVRRPGQAGLDRWRLLSHLSPAGMFLVLEEAEVLREDLLLYDFDNSPATREQINSILSIKYQRVTRRMGQAFHRGVEVTMEFDEEKSEGLFLFASVLERILAEFVSNASFTCLVAKTVQRQEPLKKWPPRQGYRPLL